MLMKGNNSKLTKKANELDWSGWGENFSDKYYVEIFRNEKGQLSLKRQHREHNHFYIGERTMELMPCCHGKTTQDYFIYQGLRKCPHWFIVNCLGEKLKKECEITKNREKIIW